MPRSCLGFARGRAEPAPPRNGQAMRRRPCGGSPGTARKAVFSEGRGLRARVGRPHASPGYRMITEERTSGRWPNREMLRSSASLSRGRAEPAPPRGGASWLGWPCGGKPGDNVEGGFLGGAHSVRPLSMAKRVPRDYVFTGWPVGAGSPTGTCPDEAKAVLAGVRSPPLRGVDHPSWDGLAVEGQGMTRKAIFSEGRGLRARVARPYSCQGISLPEVSGRVAVA
jgi:hypothetical protein